MHKKPIKTEIKLSILIFLFIILISPKVSIFASENSSLNHQDLKSDINSLNNQYFNGVVPIPNGVFKQNIVPENKDEILLSFINIPYRNDGAINEFGQHTKFATREFFKTPGLNCSGFVLAAYRFLTGDNIKLEDAIFDRKGDSGKDSLNGEDWDFGWDFILNISEGKSRRFILPNGERLEVDMATATSPRGFSIDDMATWLELKDRIKPNKVYLLSFNVENRREGYGLIHYHTGLIHLSDTGNAWLYQTTGRGGGVNRRDIFTSEGISSMQKSFGSTSKHKRMLLVLEVDLTE